MSKRAFFITGACAGVGTGGGAATGGAGVAGAGAAVAGAAVAGAGVAAGAGVPGAGAAGNAGAVLPGIEGDGVGSGSDTHPEIPIVAMAPASARDLRNLRLPIFIVSVVFIFNC